MYLISLGLHFLTCKVVPKEWFLKKGFDQKNVNKETDMSLWDESHKYGFAVKRKT